MLKLVVSPLVVLLAHSITLGGDLEFKKQVINAASDYSAAALIDVNQDGKVDVVCGGDWYESPDWKKHRAATVPRIGGRPDGFSHLEFDVNRDGWTDVITVNYRSRSIKWMKNPGRADAVWELHTVVEPGPMETGRLVDVDGDGQLDLLPNGRNFAAWWEFRWKNKTTKGTPAWIRHELPKEAKGHGVGFGDIDGDGRNDIVGQNGWLKAPADARAGEWQWHPEFKIERGSVPMLVVDPDEDGDNDIVWCSAHGFGVYWLENTKTEAGARAWVRHAIDTSWSQCHAPLWADMDGDGRNELIAGKRYMAHGGSDPGAFDPLVVYRYQFNLQTRTWDRWRVSEGDRVGLGLDPKVGDIDNDGDLDLLACGRSGLYWLENKGNGTTGANSTTATASDIQNIATPEKWGIRRSRIVGAIEQAHGGLPSCTERVQLRTSIGGKTSGEEFDAHEIRYWIDRERQVSAKLLIPKSANTTATSGIVCMFDPKSNQSVNQTASQLASLGYVCIIPNLAMAEKRDQITDGVWQAMRAADVLQAMATVHGERIGFVGDAQSGKLGLYVAALDQRFIATSTDAGRLTHLAIPRDSYTAAELVAVASPRALRVSLPNNAELKEEVKRATAIFALRNAAKRLTIDSSEKEAQLDKTSDWLRKELPAN